MKTQYEAPKCARQEELVEYLYDEMPLPRRALFAEHLSDCAACSTDLQGMQRLRGELRAWDLSTVPRMELVIPRARLDVLKELLSLFPLWSRGLLAVAGAAAMILIALGTVSLFRQMNSAPPMLAKQADPVTTVVQPAALTPEIKALVNTEVAKAVEQERHALRAQLAVLDTRNADQNAQLQTITHQLRDLNKRHQQLLAAQRPSLRSIFAEYEPGTER